ncbi:hypothetical protein GHA01_20450 [Novacetimonas hansenii]|uniref:Uncharacterized protein n=1 Tax=Novacetimonas hansenii TaxID=436 RepID=A0ABQ0SG23_NOVHA|nr:hypothetical protein Gaha_0105_026 [Novacetimonas hansenii JCM 7643]GBQ63064.1 hypothetical protein AA0243_3023 [Novacetimonas hansenii NRIC 0243]GEC64196.1 hypothetical protein GHA01_20450 [Novacetimonas hansenii]
MANRKKKGKFMASSGDGGQGHMKDHSGGAIVMVANGRGGPGFLGAERGESYVYEVRPGDTLTFVIGSRDHC